MPGSLGSDGPTPPVCYRCDDPLDSSHWIRLAAAHHGDRADRYEDVERRVCLDCLAGIGLLEFSPEVRTRAIRTARSEGGQSGADAATDESPLSDYGRLPAIRSLRSGE